MESAELNDVPSEAVQVLIDWQKECTKAKTMKLNHWLSENTQRSEMSKRLKQNHQKVLNKHLKHYKNDWK